MWTFSLMYSKAFSSIRKASPILSELIEELHVLIFVLLKNKTIYKVTMFQNAPSNA
jgi:hypothetical protein